MERVIVTGAAGFIDAQLADRLQKRGLTVKGIDNFNDHLYSPPIRPCQHFGIRHVL